MTAAAVHLWLVREEQLSSADLDGLRAVLSADERRRAARYRREADGRRSIVARGLLRHALTRYAHETSPEDWSIEVEPDGRPVVTGGPRFSVTHTPGLVAVCVTDVPVGVDAEDCERSTDIDAVARRWFHPDEAAEIESLVGEQRRRRFFEVWTVKEAYSKALGLGLKVGLDTFCVVGEDPVRVIDEVDRGDWTFATFAPTSRHTLATAVAADDAQWIRRWWPKDR